MGAEAQARNRESEFTSKTETKPFFKKRYTNQRTRNLRLAQTKKNMKLLATCLTASLNAAVVKRQAGNELPPLTTPLPPLDLLTTMPFDIFETTPTGAFFPPTTAEMILDFGTTDSPMQIFSTEAMDFFTTDNGMPLFTTDMPISFPVTMPDFKSTPEPYQSTVPPWLLGTTPLPSFAPLFTTDGGTTPFLLGEIDFTTAEVTPPSTFFQTTPNPDVPIATLPARLLQNSTKTSTTTTTTTVVEVQTSSATTTTPSTSTTTVPVISTTSRSSMSTTTTRKTTVATSKLPNLGPNLGTTRTTTTTTSTTTTTTPTTINTTSTSSKSRTSSAAPVATSTLTTQSSTVETSTTMISSNTTSPTVDVWSTVLPRNDTEVTSSSNITTTQTPDSIPTTSTTEASSTTLQTCLILLFTTLIL